jgi:uncharacterized damage-inducible protein DinB
MTTATSAANKATNDHARHCAHQLRFARSGFMRVLEGIPADKLTSLPAFAVESGGGTIANHATWIVGHLATTDDWFMQQMGAASELELSAAWHELFGGGSKPEDDASKYPPIDELVSAMQAQRERLVQWFSERSEKELAAASPEKWAKYAPTVADFAFFLAWHEGYHGGQLSVVRKCMGLAPAFG